MVAEWNCWRQKQMNLMMSHALRTCCFQSCWSPIFCSWKRQSYCFYSLFGGWDILKPAIAIRNTWSIDRYWKMDVSCNASSMFYTIAVPKRFVRSVATKTQALDGIAWLLKPNGRLITTDAWGVPAMMVTCQFEIQQNDTKRHKTSVSGIARTPERWRQNR